MPENKGYYQKYIPVRVDGKPIDGRTFTMEIDRDPFAAPALKAYRDAMAGAGGFALFVADIDVILDGLQKEE